MKPVRLHRSTLSRAAGAVLTGVLLAAAFLPSRQPESAWFALLPLLLVCRYTRPRRAFWWGWLAGAVYWLATLFWLLRLGDTGAPLPVAMLGWVALSAYSAAYVGAFAVCAAHLLEWRLRVSPEGDAGVPAKRALWRGPVLVIALPAVWVGFEYLRGVLFTGFPWNPLGVSQFRNLVLIQLAAWGGVYAVSAVIVAINTALSQTAIRFIDFYSGAYRRREFQVELMLGLLLLGGCLVWGNRVLVRAGRGSGAPAGPTVLVAPIQPNIAQVKKWTPTHAESIRDTLLVQTERAALFRPDLIVWPETALPSIVRTAPGKPPAAESDTVEMLAEAASYGAPILVGAMETDSYDDNGNWYNASFLFSPEGHIGRAYRKQHLVPFGEYLPFDKSIAFIKRLAPLGFSCTAGSTGTVFRLDKPAGATFGALICFEDIMPYLARAAVRHGAGFLVNQTNDAWFDPSTASLQHMTHCVFRCVENRVAAVRSANTGVTCTIDARGKVDYLGDEPQPRVAAFKCARIDARAPDAPLTFYTRHGDVPFAVPCAIAAVLLLCAAVFSDRRRGG